MINFGNITRIERYYTLLKPLLYHLNIGQYIKLIHYYEV